MCVACLLKQNWGFHNHRECKPSEGLQENTKWGICLGEKLNLLLAAVCLGLECRIWETPLKEPLHVSPGVWRINCWCLTPVCRNLKVRSWLELSQWQDVAVLITTPGSLLVDAPKEF